MSDTAKKNVDIPDIHQWTHDGTEVLLLKCVGKNGETHGGFRWPLTIEAIVEAPDWDPTPQCGGGLHGWPWGLSIGDGKTPDWSAPWLVFAALPSDVVDLGGKAKARTCRVVYVGDWQGATNYVLSGQIAWVIGRSSGAASATGESGAASATGWRGAASATGGRGAASATGGRGAASATGWRGAASATGWRGAASATGESGAASATGESGAASATGVCSVASVTGVGGRVRGGLHGALALAWWNSKENRGEMHVARIGCGDGSDGCLRADVWYILNAAGEFIEEK